MDIHSLDKRMVLLTRGTEIDSYYHKRLLELGYKHIYVVDKYAEDSRSLQLIGRSLRAEANTVVFEIMNNTELVTNNDKFEELRTISREMVAEIISQGKKFTIDLAEIKTFDNYVYLHSVNVAAMGILIGRDIGLKGLAMEDYGVGALLHDIGKVKIPLEILAKDGPLSDEEFAVMKEHTRKGFTLLHANNLIRPRSLAIALHHHEAYDGTGYPLGIKESEIHIFSRITTICDIFDALTSDRPYKKSWSFSNTLSYLSDKIKAKLDPSILRAFSQRVPPYPVGSTVKLSTGEQGLVIENNYSNLNRPRIKIIQDTNGKSVSNGSSNEISLADCPEIKIFPN